MKTTTVERLADFKSGNGKYKRAYAQSPERIALIKRQSDAYQTVKKSREEWKAKTIRARTVAFTLSEMAEKIDSNVLRFIASELEEALR